eukprot:CAMPEP_0113881966 /NCGR_PEP_ID=MMETSP0780_2-20120614/8679_1 /TAXON_ID=652834 /ORGANISM="Palpitomonas bilix" /LENGTH=214 /DNA_ID=CAMNT_0000868901 /DNA_START=420 /DNA_END=1064 /DNA_ORIENTATION=+ /assembly_acc=CAM_ASM_000599
MGQGGRRQSLQADTHYLSYFFLFFALFIQPCHCRILVQSDFTTDKEGWSSTGHGGIVQKTSMLFANDADCDIWYFVAPSKFLGDQSAAYNGFLNFRLGHFEFSSGGKGMIRDFDVILESAFARISLGVKDVVPPWVGSSRSSLALSEYGGWVVIETGLAPTRHQFVQVIASLTGLKIRGGYYHGFESTWIDAVTLVEGDGTGQKVMKRLKHIDL